MTDRRNERNPKGFTLVEILVVVIIIGIMATLVAQNVLGETDKAKLTKVKNDLQQIASAAERFYLDKSRLPESVQELVDEQYLKVSETPKDPWDNEYVIEEGEGRIRVVVISFGPDGSQDTEDDITNLNMASYTVEKLRQAGQ